MYSKKVVLKQYCIDFIYSPIYNKSMNEVKFRANGNGKSILYLNEEGKWKSTGQKTFIEAREWYYEIKPRDELTFGFFAESIFTDESEGSYRFLQTATGRHTRREWWHQNDGYLKRYLIPFFGETPLYKITTKMIQSWYLTFKGKCTEHLAPESKRKVLDCFNIVMGYALYCGLIPTNPVKAVIKIKITSEGRQPYTKEELAAMFPEDDDALIEVWGTLMWAVYFLISRDTGWRPSEIAALSEDCYIEKFNGIYTTKSVDSFDRKIQNTIKTSGTGYKYRVGLLSERTGKLLRRLITERKGTQLFRTYAGQLLTSTSARCIFNKRMAVLGIDTKGRPPYALRTTYMTNIAKTMSREQVEELMGHKQWRACYDKRSAEDILAKIKGPQSE